MEKFTLINKARSRIKVFEPFEDSSKNSYMINAILISYGCIFKRSSQPVIRGQALGLNLSKKREKNIKNYQRKGEKKLIDQQLFKKKWLIGTLPKI